MGIEHIDNTPGVVLPNRLKIKSLPSGVKEVLASFGYTNEPCLGDFIDWTRRIGDWNLYLNMIPLHKIGFMTCNEANVVIVDFDETEIELPSDYLVMVWYF